MRRFLGHWCKKMSEDGDHEYASVIGATEEQAHQRAIEAGKAAGEVEWVSVTEDLWVGDKRDGYWERVSRKTGDWSGYLE